ncbi:hypothetical protein [Streptomyces sp. NBC_00467]
MPAVPETAVNAATAEAFATCSGLCTFVTGAGDRQRKLRPSEESAAD